MDFRPFLWVMHYLFPVKITYKYPKRSFKIARLYYRTQIKDPLGISRGTEEHSILFYLCTIF